MSPLHPLLLVLEAGSGSGAGAGSCGPTPLTGWATSYFWWLCLLWVDKAGGYNCPFFLWVLPWLFRKSPAKSSLMEPLTQSQLCIWWSSLAPGCSGLPLLHSPCHSRKPADRTRMTHAGSLLSPGSTWTQAIVSPAETDPNTRLSQSRAWVPCLQELYFGAL